MSNASLFRVQEMRLKIFKQGQSCLKLTIHYSKRDYVVLAI